MRLRTLRSDGTRTAEPFEVRLKDQDGDEYTPPVTVMIRPVPHRDLPEIRRRATKLVRDEKTGRVRSEFQGELYDVYYYQRAIVSWSGIESEDGAPVSEPTEDAIAALITNGHIKAQLESACLNTEVADPEASFRESSGMVRVVGGSG